MPLSAHQLAQRKGRVTASFLPWLAQGDESRILNEWYRLTDDPRYVPLDLSEEWLVYRGEFSEAPTLDWHERKTRLELTRRGEVVVHPTRDWLCCTLDAFCPATSTVIDLKVINHQRDPEEALSFYAPQILVQKECLGCDYAGLLITRGDEPPFLMVLPEDERHRDYTARVLGMADDFWRCVTARVPPVEIIEAAPLTPPERWRSINLDNEADRAAHNWAGEMIAHLTAWEGTQTSAKLNEAARERIKGLLPEDCKLLTFEGVHVSRNRARSVTIKLQRAK